MTYVQKTLNAAANTGYVVQLGQVCGKVTVKTVGTAVIKFGAGPVPATPTNAYIAGAGATTDTLNLAANEEVTIGSDDDGQGAIKALQDPIEWVAVWAIGGGNILAVGH